MTKSGLERGFEGEQNPSWLSQLSVKLPQRAHGDGVQVRTEGDAG
jgi:hypothetical protein